MTLSEPKKNAGKLPAIANPLAIFFWIYIPVNTFIFSIDNFIFDSFNIDRSYLYFKYILFFIILAIIIKKYKTSTIWKTVFYVSVFPIFIFFIVIPVYLLIKSQVGLLGMYIWNFSAFAFNFKKRILHFISIIVGVTFCFWDKDFFNILGMVIIFALLINHIIERIKLSFNPKWLPTGDVSSVVNEINKNRSFEEKLISLDDSELKNRDANLGQAVFYGSFIDYLGKNAKKFNKSGMYIWIAFSQITITILFILACFSLINYSLYNLSPQSYTVIDKASFFDFIYYTVLTTVLTTLDEIKASSDLSRLIRILQFISQLTIVPSIIAFFTTYFSPNLNEELEIIGKAATERGEQLQSSLKSSAAISLRDARDELYKKGDFYAIIAAFLDGDKNMKLEDLLKIAIFNRSSRK